jgi:hypothetical protein
MRGSLDSPCWFVVGLDRKLLGRSLVRVNGANRFIRACNCNQLNTTILCFVSIFSLRYGYYYLYYARLMCKGLYELTTLKQQAEWFIWHISYKPVWKEIR